MVAVTGIGSGLDIEGLVTGLVNAERAPAELRLNRREAEYTNLISAFGALKGALSELQSSLSGVNDPDLYGQYKASSSNASAIDASATADASAGSYQLEVNRLAETQSFASVAFADTTTTVGSGTLTIDFGVPTYASDPFADPDTAYTAFTPDPAGSSVVIPIDENNNTLEGIKNAINDENAGLTASIIKDGDEFRLLLTTESTGVSNSVSISVTEDPGTPGLSALSYDAALSNLTQTRAAVDAEFAINGFTVSSASNTISDAVEGVTLTLKDVTTSVATITVAEDRTAIIAGVEKFIKGYNGYSDTLSQLTNYDPVARTRGALQGDFSARSVEGRIRAEINLQTSGISSDYNTLASIGITSDETGKLKLDKAALNSALDADPEAIAALFADTEYQGAPVQGVASRLDSVIEDLLASNGIIQGREDGLDVRIERVTDERESLAFRMEQLEKRYRDQFNAMDALLANISSSGDFLLQQLENLPGYSDGSKK